MRIKKLRSILIDDSSLQRITISKMIKSHLNLDLVAEFKNGIEAQKNIKDFKLI